MKRAFLTSFLFVSLLFGISESSADIVIDGFTDQTNDRFTNSSSFIGAGLDFSGVGRGNRWGTLISNNVIISAAHARPTGQIAFYPGNDPTVAPVLRNVVGPGLKIGSTDIYVAALDAPVPNNINFYNIASEFLSAPADTAIHDAGSFQDEVAYLYGISPTSRSDPRIDHAVGRNRISGYIEDLPFIGNTDNDSLLFIEDVAGDEDFVQYESQFRGGDSGGPSFVERNGELLLIGVNSFINGANSELEFSGVTYVGNFTDEINAFVALNAVPEPGSAGLILFAIAVFPCVRRRSK